METIGDVRLTIDNVLPFQVDIHSNDKVDEHESGLKQVRPVGKVDEVFTAVFHVVVDLKRECDDVKQGPERHPY